MITRLLSVDPSLTCSGWALFDVASEEILGVGKVRSPKPGPPLSVRIAGLQKGIRQLFGQLELPPGNTVLICEGPTSIRDPKGVVKVEQVRGIFESLAREYKLIVPDRANPRSVQVDVLGLNGRQVKRELVKETARRMVYSLFRERLRELKLCNDIQELKKHQDIVDAIIIGLWAIRRIKMVRGKPAQLHLVMREGERRLRRKKNIIKQ